MSEMPFTPEPSDLTPFVVDEGTILLCEKCFRLIEDGGELAVGMSFRVCPEHGTALPEPDLMFMHGDCFRAHLAENPEHSQL